MTEEPGVLAEVRVRCLALPEVTEGLTHGAPTWFVRGRRSFVKFVDPAEHPRLDLPHVAIWAAAPPGVRHDLVGMRLDGGPDWDEVGEVILDAYREVAPTSLAARLCE